MDLYKNFTGHRYWCILSKYTVLFPWWPYLSTKIWWIWNSDWFQLVIGSIRSTSSIASLANICYHLEFFQILLTGDRSYQYLKDATLFVLLSDKSAEIFECKYLKNWNLPPGHLPTHGVFICKWGGSDVTWLICIWKQTRSSVSAMRPVWRIAKYSNILTWISQHF